MASQWEAIGPFGGSVAVVQVDQRRGTVLAATSNGQLFSSTTGGDSWNALPFPAERRANLHTFVVDPWRPGVYLAGLSSDTEQYSGILRTSDGGLTWKRIPDPRLKDVWSIAFYDQDSRWIVAGTETGVLLSKDAGDTWVWLTASEPQMKPVVSLSFDPAEPGTIYAGTPHLAWKTTDGGATWRSIHKGMSDDSDVFSILVDDRMRQRLFAATCGGIYRSLDGGRNWTSLIRPEGTSYRSYFIAQHPRSPKVLFAGTAAGLAKSEDSGVTWRKLSSDSTRSIAFDSEHPDRIYIATDYAGLFRSDDLGESFVSINDGFCNRTLSSITGSGNALYVTFQTSSESISLERQESDERWRELDPSSEVLQHGVLKLVSSDSGILFALKASELWVSSAPGQTWTSLPTPSPESRLKDLLFVSPDGATLLISTDDEVYQSSDSGSTWNKIRLWWDPRDHLEIYDAISIGNNGLLAASSQGLLRSYDSGVTWRPERSVFGTASVRTICKHPTRKGALFASQYGTVFQSRDEGKSWTPLAPADETVGAIKALLVLPESPNRLFALVQGRGVYAITLP
jgi:photosystem II stability/assembly factor-like uncharacterized protein